MHRQSASWKPIICAAITNTRGKKLCGKNQRDKSAVSLEHTQPAPWKAGCVFGADSAAILL